LAEILNEVKKSILIFERIVILFYELSKILMLLNSPKVKMKVLFGRAFLKGLEMGDLELATLFARAFLTQNWKNGNENNT